MPDQTVPGQTLDRVSPKGPLDPAPTAAAVGGADGLLWQHLEGGRVLAEAHAAVDDVVAVRPASWVEGDEPLLGPVNPTAAEPDAARHVLLTVQLVARDYPWQPLVDTEEVAGDGPYLLRRRRRQLQHRLSFPLSRLLHCRERERERRIPPNFLQHISSEASKTATLQGPCGSHWHVELSTTENGTFLSRGWSKFLQDQSLKQFEFLVFQYNGSMHFTVLIFGTTACLREDLSADQSRKPAELNGDENQISMKHPENVSFFTQKRECKTENDSNLFMNGNKSSEQMPDYIRLVQLWSFPLSYVPSTRGYLSKGWASFSRGNNLEGDFCAFEIVGPVELCVHVFRVLEETTPLLKVS
ncbi:B3 domain-containing protein [Apostasia shenzhenica]|uniref:B3 domain-containing protein n=1 Tax=Apostasia shenzhenica TaxID=1088818 RepID=A0A2I0AGB4_9ASPA|nr:B3 domain-containing protein [Apostasia shenzhenica]